MKTYLRRYRTKLVWMALLLLVPGLAVSQSLFQGIYLGTFQGPYDAGEFALIIDDRDRSVFAVYDPVDDDGFTEHDVYIRSDGLFHLATRGYSIDGQIVAGAISGRYTVGGTEGVFNGQRAVDHGLFAEAAGFYSGPVSLSNTGSGSQVVRNTHLVAIVAADGRAFFLLGRAFANPAEFSPAEIDFHAAVPFDFGHGFDWPFDWGWGWSWNWNWGWDWDFDFRVPFFPPIGLDLDFDFNLPSFGFAWPWHHPFAAISASGGIIQLAPDGQVEATLPDGLVLQGRLDSVSGSGQGGLSQMHNSTLWSGSWFIERRPVDGFRFENLHYPLADFDGDGRDDILWRHAVTGENAVWLMDGGFIQAELPLEAQPELGWTLVALDEFDGDRQPDLVWQHPNSGELFLWCSTDTSDDTDSLPIIQLDSNWHVAGSGDFFADSRSEILVRHRVTGENGLVVDPVGQTSLLPLPTLPDQAWSVAAVANFDGDGYPDILWQNQDTAELLIWRMNGQTLIQELGIGPRTVEQPELSGVGDFNGDGVVDILHRDTTTGSMLILLIAEGYIHAEVNLGPGLGPLWQVLGIGDFDGDGSDDLLWRHDVTDETTVWRIANAQLLGNESLNSVADLHWTVQP